MDNQWTIEKKYFEFEAKDITDTGQFTGYAAIFGNVDEGGDLIERGAFKKTLMEKRRKAPIFHEHKVAVGAADLEENDVGLRAIGTFNLDKISAREAYSDLKFYKANGIRMGMSIGYRPVGTPPIRSDGVRILKELKLYEVTLTLIPMNEQATVTDVKSRQNQRRPDHDKLCALIQAIRKNLQEDTRACEQRTLSFKQLMRKN